MFSDSDLDLDSTPKAGSKTSPENQMVSKLVSFKNHRTWNSDVKANDGEYTDNSRA